MSGDRKERPEKSRALSELPADELVRYGQELGVQLNAKMGRGELLRRIRERQELLLDLEREAMLDIVVWARHPVRASASKEELARLIASIGKMDFQSLSDRGLCALARLRDVPCRADEPREEIEARIRSAEPFMNRLRRGRRRVVAGLITRVVNGYDMGEPEAYRFLPEEGAAPSLKERIAEDGVVGSVVRRIRGVADDYVREKLDEIEARIDQKLDEIDSRLAEWRDQEVANRLKLIKITLVASILVAILSLAYSYVKSRSWDSRPEPPESAPVQKQAHAPPPADWLDEAALADARLPAAGSANSPVLRKDRVPVL